jgi:NADH-quinone oxidoreductase subunit L
LVLLAVGAAVAGFIPFGNFVSPDGKPVESVFHLQFSIAPVLLASAGISLAMVIQKKIIGFTSIAALLGSFYKAAFHKFYMMNFTYLSQKNIVQFNWPASSLV